ncbi:hypothetical protein ACLOJK_024821 [Asimina triloba]
MTALKPKTPFQTSLAHPSVSMARALPCPSSFLKHLASSSNSGLFSSFPPNYKLTHLRFHAEHLRAIGRLSISGSRLNEDWLSSLSCPPVGKDGGDVAIDGVLASASDAVPTWVLGVDPDVSGAVAVLRCDSKSVVSSQVFDTPYVRVLVGKRVRKRLDAKSIVELLRSLEAPMGTAAYIEQSIPFPKDGKQDDSRRAASTLFPSLDSLLKRKKDHVFSVYRYVKVHEALYGALLKRLACISWILFWDGSFCKIGASLSNFFPLSMDNGCVLKHAGADVTFRGKQPSQRVFAILAGRAEALLIAAYGKGLTVQSETSST